MAESEQERKAKANVRVRAWYESNKDRKKVYDKLRYAANREEILAKERARKAADPELTKARDRAKYVRRRPQILEQKLQKAYGISKADFDRMLEEQRGCCAICKTDDWKGKHGSPCVDHCHASNRVRALLCSECNLAIGQMRDDAERLRAAADYLDFYKKKS